MNIFITEVGSNVPNHQQAVVGALEDLQVLPTNGKAMESIRINTKLKLVWLLEFTKTVEDS